MDGQDTNVAKSPLKEKGLNDSVKEEIILKIDKKCVFKTKIENINEINSSIFKDVYLRASECLDRIIDYAEQITDNYFENYDHNNIITFIGSRGAGKTSVMKSFRNSLNSKTLKTIEIEEYKKIKNNSFELLNVIDSSSLSSEKSILEVIVYYMYKNFKEKETNDNITEMIALDNEFNQVYNDISMIKGDNNKKSDDFKLLFNITSIITIKEHIKSLVDKYIDYLGNDKGNNKFLVISIDNFDISLTPLKKVIEEIRKYFSIPNVIILITANIKKETDNEINMILDNIIPFSRRIYMPNLNQQDFKLVIDRNYFRNIPNIVEQTAQQTIISILFLKLRYIISTQKHYNEIIPSNLSKFIELVVFLDSIKEEYTYEKKMEVTSTYYEKVVIKEIQEEKDRAFLIKLLKSDLTNINRQSLSYINSLIYENKKDLCDNGELWNDILYLREKRLLIEEDRVNLGDIITWIKRFENLIENDEERKFIEVFKSIYTLRLLEVFYTKPDLLLSKTGFDFSGRYFNVALNKFKDKLNRIISVDEEYALGELKYCFKSMNSYLLSVLLHPVLDSNLHYSRLIRSEYKNSVKLEDVSKFNKFEVNFCNIVGYSLYEKVLKTRFDQELAIEEEFEVREKDIKDYQLNHRLLFIINIDLWMKTLEILDIKYDNSKKVKKDFLIESIDIVNQTFESYSYRYRFNKYGNIIGPAEIDMIRQLYEVFEKIYYLHKNKY